MVPPYADVVSCIYDATVAYQRNGQPAPGIPGQASGYVVSTTLMFHNGSGPTGWVVMNGPGKLYNTAAQAGPLCAGG